ncbi:hypothetical protein GOBAR_DD34924 [Gossypium barbadense]|nr:hypothetical protein GOBAR_DD34924 [Gossypium barbadense]
MWFFSWRSRLVVPLQGMDVFHDSTSPYHQSVEGIGHGRDGAGSIYIHSHGLGSFHPTLCHLMIVILDGNAFSRNPGRKPTFIESEWRSAKVLRAT